MIRRSLLAMSFAVLVGSALAGDPLLRPWPVKVPCQPACAVTPHKEVVHRTGYSTRCDSFCLQSVSLASLWRQICGEDCGPVCCDPPRTKARLVKWDLTEERIKLKCTVDSSAPILAPSPIAAPPFIIVVPKK